MSTAGGNIHITWNNFYCIFVIKFIFSFRRNILCKIENIQWKREDTEISVLITPKNIPPWWLYTRSGFLLCSFLFAISETDHVRLEPSEGEHQRSNKTSQHQLQQILHPTILHILQLPCPSCQCPLLISVTCDTAPRPVLGEWEDAGCAAPCAEVLWGRREVRWGLCWPACCFSTIFDS